MSSCFSNLRIVGDKVVLQAFGDSHMNDPCYFQWLSTPEVMASINRVEYLLPFSFSEVEQYVRRLQNSPSDAFFAILRSSDDGFIGTLRLMNINWRLGTCEVGIMIGDQTCWRKGFAKDAVRVACDYAFNKLSLRKVSAETNGDNVAMCRCFLSLGFEKEGILREHARSGGAFVDRVIFGLFSDELKPE